MRSTIIGALAALSLISTAAVAAPLYDNSGNAVQNTFNNSVSTKWDAPEAAKPAKKAKAAAKAATKAKAAAKPAAKATDKKKAK